MPEMAGASRQAEGESRKNKQASHDPFFSLTEGKGDRRIWSSYKVCMVDALVPEADEGRDKLR
jgi:hypothetical protein